MKTKFTRAGRRSISIILAVMMIISTMLIGAVSVNAASNGDTLYFRSGTESSWKSSDATVMTYANSVYTTTLDFTGVSQYTWYVLSIHSSSTDSNNCVWSSAPTVTTNTEKISQIEIQQRDGVNNVVHFQIGGSATSDYVKVTYNLTSNTVTFDPDDSSGGGSTGGETGGDKTLYLFGDLSSTVANPWNKSVNTYLFTYDSTSGWYVTGDVEFSGSKDGDAGYSYFRFYDATDSSSITEYGPTDTQKDQVITNGEEATPGANSVTSFKYAVGSTPKTVNVYVSSDLTKVKVVEKTGGSTGGETGGSTSTIYVDTSLTGLYVWQEVNSTFTPVLPSTPKSGTDNDYWSPSENNIKSNSTTTIDGKEYYVVEINNFDSGSANFKMIGRGTYQTKDLTSTTDTSASLEVGKSYVLTLNSTETVTENNTTKYSNCSLTEYTGGGTVLPSGTYTIATAVKGQGTVTASNANTAVASGTANEGDVITVATTPGTNYSDGGVTAELGYKITTDGVAAKKVTYPITITNGTFTVPSLTDLGVTLAANQSIGGEITVTATFNITDKSAVYSEGLWVDVQPGVTTSTLALIKWTDKFGPNGNTGNTRTLYLPSGTDMNNLHIYSQWGDSLDISGATKNADGTWQLSAGTSYTVTNANYTLEVYQSSANSVYTYTNTALPTTTDSSLSSKSSVKTAGDVMTVKSDGTIDLSVDVLNQIKGRGNSSWEASYLYYGKYAYNMKFDSKQSPFGLPKSKSFCLLANNMDETSMRNIVTYETAALAGVSNAPQYQVVDLYNNGEYLGSYLLTQKVDVGADKLISGTTLEDYYDGVVPDTNPTTETTGTFSYNGGTKDIKYTYSNGITLRAGVDASQFSYLLEFDLELRAKAEHCWFKTPQGQYVVVNAPEDLAQSEMQFIIQKWLDAESAVYNGAYSDMQSLMDLDSFADVYLVQEFTKNLDSGATSYFVYWDGTQASPKWEATPIWDYDWALGGHGGTKSVQSGTDSSGAPGDVTGWLTKYKKIDYGTTYTDTLPDNINFQAKLAQNTDFWNSNVINSWNSDFYDSIIQVFGSYTGDYNGVTPADNGYMRQNYDTYKASYDMDEARWGFVKSNNSSPLPESWGSIDNGTTLDACYSTLINWALKRADWMNQKLTETATVALTSNATAATKSGDTLTLTADVTKTSSYAMTSYNFYISKDGGSTYTALASATEPTYSYTLTSGGAFSYYVEAMYSSYVKAVSDPITVTVEGEAEAVLEGVTLSASTRTPAPGTRVTFTITPSLTTGTTSTITYKLYSGSTAVATTTSTSSNAVTLSYQIPADTADKTALSFTATAAMAGVTKTSAEVTATVTAQQTSHDIVLHFKSASAAAYKPYVSLDSGAAVAMTFESELGDIYSGALKIYWYTATLTAVDSTVSHTLTITTKGTDLSVTMTDNFNANEYYLAADNIMSDTGEKLIDLTGEAEYKRNYYQTPLHMVYSALIGDANVGFTVIQGTSHRMGDIVDADGNLVESFSINSVTTTQYALARLTTVSEVQNDLLDVNLDGAVDINDVTMMQMALALY